MILQAPALVCCVLAPYGFQSRASLQVTLFSDSDRPRPWRPPEWNGFLYGSGESEFLIVNCAKLWLSAADSEALEKKKEIKHRSIARGPRVLWNVDATVLGWHGTDREGCKLYRTGSVVFTEERYKIEVGISDSTHTSEWIYRNRR